jgi:hypothetical protein
MLNQRSFSEILKDFTIEESTSSSNFTSGYESHLEPHGIAWLMSEINLPQQHSRLIVKKAYPIKARRVCARPPHIFSADQTRAFEFIKQHAPQLQDNFNRQELKSAYRLSVLKTHPDQGGNSEIFQDVKKSYQILLALVKN